MTVWLSLLYSLLLFTNLYLVTKKDENVREYLHVGRLIFFSVSHNKLLEQECLWGSLASGYRWNCIIVDFLAHKGLPASIKHICPQWISVVIRRRLTCAHGASCSFTMLFLSCSRSSSLMTFAPDGACWVSGCHCVFSGVSVGMPKGLSWCLQRHSSSGCMVVLYGAETTPFPSSALVLVTRETKELLMLPPSHAL